jgi:hypothetical protein
VEVTLIRLPCGAVVRFPSATVLAPLFFSVRTNPVISNESFFDHPHPESVASMTLIEIGKPIRQQFRRYFSVRRIGFHHVKDCGRRSLCADPLCR